MNDLSKFFEDKKPKYLDDVAEKIIKKSENMLIPWYLLASYVYYKLGSTIISDACFDRIAKSLGKKFDSLTHMHKYLLEDIAKSKTFNTGFDLPFDNFPKMIIGSAKHLQGRND